METCTGELAEISDVVVVKMGDDAVGDRFRIDVEKLQAVDRTAQKFAPAASADILGETGVNQEDPILPGDDPGEVVNGHWAVVRIATDEMVGSSCITGRIPDCEDFVFRQRIVHVVSSILAP